MCEKKNPGQNKKNSKDKKKSKKSKGANTKGPRYGGLSSPA
jgi:hypothetical protein